MYSTGKGKHALMKTFQTIWNVRSLIILAEKHDEMHALGYI